MSHSVARSCRPTVLRRSRAEAGLTALAVLALLGGGLIVGVASRQAGACPFCTAVKQTFAEEVGAADAAVIAKLVSPPPKPNSTSVVNKFPESKFEIIEVIKGQAAVGKTKQLSLAYFGESPVGSKFLVMGIDPANLNWSTPIMISDRGCDYLHQALKQPKDGPERLVFFQDYLEDSDEMLARDAYDEFAKAPYSLVKQIKDRMHHDKLMAWVADPNVTGSRRRLYFTMLGACGTPDDLATFETIMRSTDRSQKAALDALIAAYLMLKGPDGMPLVEELFLAKKDAEYTDTYSAIMALRFHGQEETVVPRPRLLAGLRTMLDRPQLADLVIPDLARWEDWSAMDRLVQLFKEADDSTSWVRIPVIKYLQACPLPEAKQRLAELTELDPEAVKRAKSFFTFMPGGAAPAKVPVDAASSVKKTTTDNHTSPDKQSASDPAAAGAAKPNDAKPSGAKTPSAKSPAKAPPAQPAAEQGASDAASGAAVQGQEIAAVEPENAATPGKAAAAPANAAPADTASGNGEVAAIGHTTLAPLAIAAKNVRPLGPVEVGGGLTLLGAVIFGIMGWLFWGGQRARV